MFILSPDGRKTLKYYLENLKELRENIAWVVYHDLQDTEDTDCYRERIERAKLGLLQIRRQVKPVEAVITEFLYALDDQEIIVDEIGTILQHWDFETPNEPDETNPPA